LADQSPKPKPEYVRLEPPVLAIEQHSAAKVTAYQLKVNTVLITVSQFQRHRSVSSYSVVDFSNKA